MVNLIGRLIFLFISNVLALWLVNHFVAGFEISSNYIKFATVAGVLSPFIIITLGLGIILINAAILYFLDSYSADISITGLNSLFYATIIIGAVNFVTSFIFKRLHKD
ncbi:MAG: hypothetical protein US36_C0022G0006 [Candidatus Wolfebacteria bacterium GW2011_GWC1_37_10]|uniref:Phage holin family protein n=1 Tax=Candidatus Wolfebacteria bacterium GW2011_GWC1_37_10 TaxID=1619010 RepID=A0A0G0FTX1_9BACT|nr:MAG: hypothetical protein US36_C0022G0006 [Candidatus Wolfebacteria bacterium GW2011_GWC1_37_10]